MSRASVKGPPPNRVPIPRGPVSRGLVTRGPVPRTPISNSVPVKSEEKVDTNAF